MRAAIFDMDKTLLRVDTAMSWTSFLYNRGEIGKRTVAKAFYWAALYRLALLDMETVFTRLVEDLRGDSEAEMIEKSEIWYRAHIEPEIAPAARVAVEAHRRAGDVIVLATGSTQYAARPVARGVGIPHVLSSQLGVQDGTFTGKPAAMCFGHHKVALAEKWARENGIDLDASTFYSDSYNDLPMLERVGTAIAVNPDARLRRHAKRLGWRVEQWA